MIRSKNLSFLSFIVLLEVFLLFNNTIAQPSCEIKCVVNPVSITASSFQFDILIKAKDSSKYGYIKGQYCFSYNTAIRPGGIGGTWTLNIIDSELPEHKRCSINSQSTRPNGVFVIWGPPDTPDEFIVSDSAYVLVARIQANLSAPFVENMPLHFQWRKTSPNPFTKLYYNSSPLIKRLPIENMSYSMNGGEISFSK